MSMARHRLNGLVGALVAGSLIFSSSAAIASAPAPAPQADPWAVLTAMTGGAPAATMCGAAVAAAAAQTPTGCVLPVLDAAPPPVAQAAPPPVPVPPVAAPAAGLGISPLILGLLAIAAGVGIYLAVRHHGHANSPA
jgi:hypothetical protein